MNPQHLRYAITDRTLISGNHTAALTKVACALAAQGVEFLQLREKDLPASTLAALARSLLGALSGTPTRLLINSRVDIALATRADGVHLTASPHELTPRQVHQLYAEAELPGPILTVSCHTLEDVRHFQGAPLTAILFGPVFEKTVAGERRSDGVGLDLLRQACALAAPIPVLALGGVTTENTAACLEAGARGVAGIRLFLQS